MELLMGTVPRGWSVRAALLGVYALAAWFLLGAGAATPAAAAGGPLPECSDFVDNDGDGRVDLADTDCAGATDDSEGSGGGACGPVPCVTFLTRFDPDGPGGTAPVVCQHGIIAAVSTPIDSVTAQPIDVTTLGCGGAADVSVAVRVPTNLDTKRPTIKVNKLVGGNLPLRIEAVQVDSDDPARRETIGYDTLNSSAPDTFTAALNLNNQDSNPQTSDTLVDLTIAGPGAELALVSDGFVPGDSLDERRQLTQNRLTFRGDGAGAVVPSAVGIDLSISNNRQEVDVTRSEPTILDFLVGEPRDDPLITGTLNRLPSSAGVLVNDVDTNSDGKPDRKTIVYDASEPVTAASVNVTTLRRGQRRRDGGFEFLRQRISANVTGLPGTPGNDEDVKLVYAGLGDTLDYTASAKIPFAGLSVLDDAPLFGRAKFLSAGLAGVPRNLHADLGPGHVELDALGDTIDYFSLRARHAPPLGTICIPTIFNPCTPPEDGVSFTDNANTFDLRVGVHRLKRADVTLDPDIDVTLDTAPEMIPDSGCHFEFCRNRRDHQLIPIWRTPFNVHLSIPRKPGVAAAGQQLIDARVMPLQPNTRLRLRRANGGTVVRYGHGVAEGSGRPTITLDGTDMNGLPEGSEGKQARILHLKLTNVPASLEFSAGKDGFPITADASAPVDVEVQMTSGANKRLAAAECVRPPGNPDPCPIYRTLDGLLLRDKPNEFVIFARLRGLRHLFVHQIGSATVAELDSQSSDNERALRIDSEKTVRSRFGPSPTVHTGTENLIVTLDKLPRHVRATTIAGRRTVLDYEANETVETFEFDKTQTFPTHPTTSPTTQELKITPMSADVFLCSEPGGAGCADHTFDQRLKRVREGIAGGGIPVQNNDANAGSSMILADPPAHFRYAEQRGQVIPVVFDLDIDRFVTQAHVRKWDCVGQPAFCRRGYIAMDTGWDKASGQPPGDGDVVGGLRASANFNFPEASAMDKHVYAFQVTPNIRIITVGPINCPSGFSMSSGGEPHTDGFCKGEIFG